MWSRMLTWRPASTPHTSIVTNQRLRYFWLVSLSWNKDGEKDREAMLINCTCPRAKKWYWITRIGPRYLLEKRSHVKSMFATLLFTVIEHMQVLIWIPMYSRGGKINSDAHCVLVLVKMSFSEYHNQFNLDHRGYILYSPLFTCDNFHRKKIHE